MKLSTIILVVLILAFIAQTVYFYPHLPETIASHFDASGKVNGMMSKNSYFAFLSILLVLLVAVFSSVSRWLPKMPDSMINVPNKEYWLSPERREETFAVFGSSFAWMAVAVTALFIAIDQIVLSANVLRKDVDPLAFWIVLGVFFVIVIALIFVSLKRFFRTPAV